MDQERERIQADLRGLLDCEVRCDDAFVQMYASDASIYQIRPLAVVRPRGIGDVVACVQYGAENDIPLHARGAGSGLAGESLGAGIVLDFSRHMRRVLEVGEDTVRVQPGVVHAQLNRHLAPYGRLFGPDPATRSVTTMGSVLALDASGSHWPIYGSARGRVDSMSVVLASGQVVKVSRHPTTPSTDEEAADPLQTLVRRLANLIERERETIAQGQPKTLVNRSGYFLSGVLENDQLDLARLLVGSEGTLALIAEATVRTDPIPKYRGLTLLFFDRLELAARGALEVRRLQPAACDIMDRRLLTIARDTDAAYEQLIPREAEALLLVEQQGDDAAELRDRMEQVTARLQRRKRLAFAARSTLDREERNNFWRLARRVIPTLYRLKGSTRALPFVEDIAIPPETLPDFLVRVQNVLKSHQVTASMFGHAGHGQLHIRPFLDLANADDVRKMHDLAAELYDEVLAAGGTISGEHGDGLSRTWFLRRQFGPLYGVFREVKRIFDPQNIFNPGKIVADAPQPIAKNLRPVVTANPAGEDSTNGEPGDGEVEPAGAAAPMLTVLNWNDEDIAYTARSCNGCGRCRTQSPQERMCPIFRLAPTEEASPRAKANLIRAVLTGRMAAAELETDALKAIADLCVNCHQCRLECPASVDIPKLVTEWKGRYVAANGLRFSPWLLSRPDLLLSLASRFRSTANWAVTNRVMRWLLEKTTGIAQGRKLPKIATRNFLRVAHRRRLTRPSRPSGRNVLYFVDVYANWCDVQLADAFTRVMKHNGVSVYVHPGQLPSGMPLISVGALDAAKRMAAKNVAILAEAVRQGYQIVATEPAAALCLAREYPNLLDDDDARLVAENTSEACAYLWRMHQLGRLELDLKPINAALGYHLPCHQRALGETPVGENLLRLIPGLTVQRVEKGCSGMAGMFGMQRANYRSSLRAGWGLISTLRDSAVQAGATECSTCKIQMEQGVAKPTIHPIKLLALAYGLMPEIETLLTARSEELTVT